MKYVLLFVLLLIYFNAISQKNQINLGFQGARYFNVLKQFAPDMPTLEFTNLKFRRNVSDKFSLYTQVNLRTEIYFRRLIGTSSQFRENALGEHNEGKIMTRGKYDHFDLGVQYVGL